MTNTYSNENDIIKVLAEIDGNLHQVEVKGDSVQYLLTARVLIKQLIQTTKEVNENTNKEG